MSSPGRTSKEPKSISGSKLNFPSLVRESDFLREILQSIVDYGRLDLPIDHVLDARGAYSSSSTYMANPRGVWLVDFHSGGVGVELTKEGYYVRAVRTIPPGE